MSATKKVTGEQVELTYVDQGYAGVEPVGVTKSKAST